MPYSGKTGWYNVARKHVYKLYPGQCDFSLNRLPDEVLVAKLQAPGDELENDRIQMSADYDQLIPGKTEIESTFSLDFTSDY